MGRPQHPEPLTHGDKERGVPLRAVPPPDDGGNAGVREPARARLTPLPEQQPEQRTERRTITERVACLRGWMTPPNPKTTPPPTWDQLRCHGDHGRHAPATGWPHTLSVAWSRTVALPARAAAVWLDWLARSPSRCLAAGVLYALVAHVPGDGVAAVACLTVTSMEGSSR